MGLRLDPDGKKTTEALISPVTGTGWVSVPPFLIHHHPLYRPRPSLNLLPKVLSLNYVFSLLLLVGMENPGCLFLPITQYLICSFIFSFIPQILPE